MSLPAFQSAAGVPAKLGAQLPDRIGSTPLLRLGRIVQDLNGITLLAKAEWTSPGGSVKDRSAASMVAMRANADFLRPARRFPMQPAATRVLPSPCHPTSHLIASALLPPTGRTLNGLRPTKAPMAPFAARTSWLIARKEHAVGRMAVIVTVLPDSEDKYLSERFREER